MLRKCVGCGELIPRENLIKITNKIKLVEQPFRNILELRFINGLKIEEVSNCLVSLL